MYFDGATNHSGYGIVVSIDFSTWRSYPEISLFGLFGSLSGHEKHY